MVPLLSKYGKRDLKDHNRVLIAFLLLLDGKTKLRTFFEFFTYFFATVTWMIDTLDQKNYRFKTVFYKGSKFILGNFVLIIKNFGTNK